MVSRSDTQAIHAVVRRTRFRLRAQAALDAALFVLIFAGGIALLAAYLRYVGYISPQAFTTLYSLAAVAVIAAACWSASRRLPTHVVATRLDRASGLSDRLATACEFEDRPSDDDPVTRALVAAAISDAAKHAHEANVKKAAPYSFPSHWPASLAGAVFAVLALFLPEARPAPIAAPTGDTPPTVEDKRSKDRVTMDDEEVEFQRAQVDLMRQTAVETNDPALKDLADELDRLLDQAKKGELTKRQLLDKLAKAEAEYMSGSEEEMKKTMDELAKTGRELAKNKMTKALGKALAKRDLEKAKQEFAKLQKKLEDGKINDKEKQQLAKALDKAGKSFEKRAKKEKESRRAKIDKKRDELRRLREKLKAAANDKREQDRLRRQVQRKKRELDRLERKDRQETASAQRRHLERLHRDMRKAAEQLNKGESPRQASRTMHDIQRSTGKIDLDRRKLANRKKVRSQLADLKEAMRRAKRKGGGQRDLMGRNKRKNDFGRRARGKQGNRKAWSRGNSKQPGTQAGGKVLGDATKTSGNTKDVGLQGAQSKEGSSVRETILSAANRGFASRSYKEVFAKYRPLVEEVIEAESVPSGYKYYVKRYFQNIKPRAAEAAEETP